ncbi:MAG: hypothetical protein RL268_890 [Pseudomonadota bacterium]
MSSLAKNMKTLAAVVGFAAAGVATGAQAQTTKCGLTAISAQANPAIYDPFEPTGLASTTIDMTITRDNLSGGATTSILNFYLRANSATGSYANGIEIIPLSIAGQAALEGVGLDIFYGTNETNYPVLLPITVSPTSASKFAKISFTGNNAGSDSVQVKFQVNIPPNLNLSASQDLKFDAYFGCNIQGGKDNGTETTGDKQNAVVFPVQVLSALRTYFAGTALDFGEIGLVNSADYNAKNTGDQNYVFVQSSGAYDVTLSSANAFVMKNSNGGNTDNDKVKYKLNFLGNEVNNTTNPVPGQVAITVNCKRAGLTTEGRRLPIKATLLEPGAGKNPSPLYSDTLTVTLAPKIYSEEGVSVCGV